MRPLTTRVTFEKLDFPLLFFGLDFGEATFGGGGMAFLFPINPRQVGAPHLHTCSLAPSNHEKL